MRAVAILLVLFSHLLKDGVVPGGLGVTFFFFISGFLITGLLIDELDRSSSIDIKGFYIRRFMRLAPALLTMVAVVSLTYFLAFGVSSANEVIAAVFYFMNFYVISKGAMALPLGPLWSLAIEEHFYLVFPILVANLWKFGERFLIGLAVVCCAVLVWRIFLVSSGMPEIRTYVGTDTRIDSILFGALLAIGIRLKLNLDWLASRMAVTVSLILLLATLVIRNPTFRETARYSIQGLAFFPLFYFILYRQSVFRTLLETPAATWIGKISYSLYLWHFPILAFVTPKLAPHTNPVITGSAVLGISFFLASLSYYFVETPLRRLAPARPHPAAVTG